MRLHFVIPLAGSLLLGAACGGDDLVGPVAAEVRGTWEAHSGCAPRCGFSVHSTSNPADSLDLLRFGAEIRLTLERGGAFQLFFGLGVDTTLVGTARTEPGLLIFRDGAGAVDTVDYALADGLLELRFRNEVRVVDFNGDGMLDPARARAILRRR
jgi:hypothetical protein